MVTGERGGLEHFLGKRCEVGKSGRPRRPLGCSARFWPRSKWRVLRTHVGCVELGGLLNVWWK